MTYLDGKELYSIFVQSDWWKDLSWRVRKKARFRCHRCGKLAPCQAHHLRYPENWFDTTESDLECICRECHEKEHGLCPSVAVRPVQAIQVAVLTPMDQLYRLRGSRVITRSQFKKAREDLGRGVSWEQIERRFEVRMVRRRKKGHRGKTKRNQFKERFKNKVCHLNIYPHHHWIQRGNSSN